MRRCLLLIILVGGSLIASTQHISTAQDREALFEYILEKTLDRESFSPVKEKTLGIDVVQAMLNCKEDIVNASSDIELYYALQKLSAARADRHLAIDQIEGGLSLPAFRTGTAPIRFHPDFSTPGAYYLFVCDVGKELGRHTGEKDYPEIGDKMLEINEQPFADYFSQAKQYTRYSGIENLWRRMAYSLSVRHQELPPSFFDETLTLLLQRSNGETYSITLPYLKSVNWKYGPVQKNYEGYELAWKRESFHVYTPTDAANKTMLLWWYGFRGDLQKATDQLIEYAEDHNMLDYDLIIDAVDSRGGSQGAYALARMSSHPFKTTGGNIKLSDITDDFIAGYTRGYVERKDRMDGSGREAEDDGTWVMDWLHGPVMQGLAAGQEYSNNVPFKCAHLPHFSDWMMQPADKHFTGRLVLLLGPWGGSHLSQFAAMVIDNNLGHTIGMNDGGYSNTWEWEEDLVFPISGKPVVRFMWSIGHTIRPNGQILEGNPAQVREYIPVTRENYLEYKQLLLKKAHAHLNQAKS